MLNVERYLFFVFDLPTHNWQIHYLIGDKSAKKNISPIFTNVNPQFKVSVHGSLFAKKKNVMKYGILNQRQKQ